MATVGAARVVALCVVACASMSTQAAPVISAAMSAGMREHPLCAALDSIGPGEQRPVVVSGIFGAGPESRVVYGVDCTQNVQPVTWVEFSHDTIGMDLLEQATANDRDASVLLKGTLYGPRRPPVVNDVIDLFRLQLLRSGQRYGHLSSYRTKLVVSEILRADAVPSDLRTEVVPFWSPPVVQVLPPVVSGDIPRYPELARSLDISGSVELHVSVADGAVAEIEVMAGHPALAEEALRTVRTWRFAKEARTAFDTCFHFQLESRPLGDNQNARVEMQLPSWIKVTGVPAKW